MPMSPSNKPSPFFTGTFFSLKKERGKPNLIITLGDPAGIGPEVTLKALLNPQVRNKANFLLIGDKIIVEQLKKRLSISNKFNLLELEMVKEKIIYGQTNPVYGKASLAYITKAAELMKQHKADALITAPVNKESINLAGYNFSGHSEYLAKLDKAKKIVMMFTSPKLKISLVTRHMALNKISRSLKIDDICETIIISAWGLKKYFKLPKPKIAVCSLNPHAGEGGKFGQEEEKIILPAIAKAKKYVSDIIGPLPSDTLFAKKEKFDLIVAMYHDQGMIPVKILAFRKAVNVTLGLSFIRTSPAHGTAYDIAGRGVADQSSMVEAIKMAIFMVRQKQ